MSDWVDDDWETCRYCGARGERGAVCHSPWRAERCQQPHDDGHAPQQVQDDGGDDD